MQIVNRAIDVPRTAVAVEAQANGTYKVYEAGDALPAWAQYDPAKAAAVATQQAQDAVDAIAARSYAKLQALVGMTPAQVQTWVANNVTTLAQAQDAIATLAIAVSVLARRL